MAIRNIRIIGDEILHKKSRPVDKIDGRILELLDDMAETMYDTKIGMGLAAPQVGVLRRLVVLDVGEGLVKLINPQVVEAAGSRVVVEACLSVPSRHGKVVRPEKVKVRAQDITGKEFFIEAEGNLAKCLCHEIDHLDGILYVDKAIEMS